MVPDEASRDESTDGIWLVVRRLRKATQNTSDLDIVVKRPAAASFAVLGMPLVVS